MMSFRVAHGFARFRPDVICACAELGKRALLAVPLDSTHVHVGKPLSVCVVCSAPDLCTDPMHEAPLHGGSGLTATETQHT